MDDLTRLRATMERRVAQQEFIAVVSGDILRGESIAEIIRKAPPRIAELLNASFAKILKKKPDREEFELVAGFGFRDPCGAAVPGGLRSQAGYTLHGREPVIVDDLNAETRFYGPQLLFDHGIRSGISTVIAGPEGDWGVLSVHSNDIRSFSADDANFIRAVANVLSTGLQREASIRALHESEERLALALAAGNLGVHDYDPRTGSINWDRTVRKLWGVADDVKIDYQMFLAGVHPDDRAMVQVKIDDACAPGGPGRFEAVYRVNNAKDHALKWVRADGNVTFENGAPVRLVGTATDITENRRIEQHVQLLMREVNHRAKNLLAVVQAIARQTAKDSEPAEFVDLLGQRLQALAAAQDLIIGGDWRRVSLRELVLAQLSHLGDGINARIAIAGEDAWLTTAAAQGLGLALHELATNAMKYGALSGEQGRVDIRWGQDAEGWFAINWRESGGPPVEPPTRRGFGTTVIERMAAGAVDGKVDLDFAREGLIWRLVAPLSGVLYDADSALPEGQTQASRPSQAEDASERPDGGG